MQLILLGSGTAIPLRDRASPSLVLIVGGHPILFDMGPGTMHQLMRAGINHERLGKIFLSHFHPDHTADLIHFLFAARNPSVFRRRTPFTVIGPSGLAEFVQGLHGIYPEWLSLPSNIMAVEELAVEGRTEKDYGHFKVVSQPVKHTPRSLAYRVESRSGKSMVYSGDTGFCPEIVDLAKGADLLVLEASFPEGEEADGHLTPSQAGRIASLSKVPRLVLTHFYPECLRSDIPSQCRASYDGELTLGEDLLHIRI